MKLKILIFAITALLAVSCGNKQKSTKHDHSKETAAQNHDHSEDDGHQHANEAKIKENGHVHADGTFHAEAHTEEGSAHDDDDHETTKKDQDGHYHTDGTLHTGNHNDQSNVEEKEADNGHQHPAPATDDGHNHDDVKLQITAYSNEFEVFAEADPFVTGNKSNVLAHFSNLPNFSALESGSIKVRLLVHGKEVNQTLGKPTRKGIYSFDITPKTSGIGVILFDIKTKKGEFQLIVPEVEVFTDNHDAIHEAEEAHPSSVNAVSFTKEQSWKIGFATEEAMVEPFGQVIKTTALVKSAQGGKVIVSAKTNGILKLSNTSVLEGNNVSKGQKLFSISGSGLANNNSAVRFAQAKNEFEKAKASYDRIKELADDKIVSEKELINSKNEFENTKVVYDNLNKNFNSSGQNVSSPMNGFVKQLWVENGQYVEAGQAIVSISQDKNILLHADVQQKYAPILGTIKSANIHTLYEDKIFTLEELDGKVLSYGKTTNTDNYMIPVHLQVANRGGFVSGSFVEVYLKTITNSNAITIPNSAFLEEQGNFFVFVQLTPELFEKREVKPGATDGIKTEVINGLAYNERVVTKGAILIKLSQASGALDAHSGHVH